MEHTDLYYVVRSVLLQLPSLLAIVGCIVFAIVRRQRYPKVSLTAAAGLGLLFLHAVVFAFVFAFVPDWLVPSGNFRARQTLVSVISFIYNSSLAIGLAVLLMAVFMQRNTPTSRPEGDGKLA